MRTLYVYLLSIVLIVPLLSFRFTSDKPSTYVIPRHGIVDSIVNVGPQKEGALLHDGSYSLVRGKKRGFIAFREALAFKESQGKYYKVNSLGYMGKYQFGMTTLQLLGVRDSVRFLNSPSLQEKIFIKNLRYNHETLQPFIKDYLGKKVGGVYITESGILAAAHLAGPGGVKRFLRTGGRRDLKDAYGSSVKYYLKRFGGYHLDDVLAKS